MRANTLALTRCRTDRFFISGILVIVIETSTIRLFTDVAQLLNSVCAVVTLMVSSLSGLWPGLATAVASAIAFDLFVTPPLWILQPLTGQFLTTLAIFLVTAILASAISVSARSLVVEADARTEADQFADILPGASEVRTERPKAVRLPSAMIKTGATPADETNAADPVREDERAEWERFRRIADEQAALRNLATLVAHGAPPSEVFDAVAREMAQVLGTDHTVIVQYVSDSTPVMTTGTWNYEKIVASGTRWELEDGTVSELVFRTRTPGRIDKYQGEGTLSATLRERGVFSSVGCPIMVSGDLWGVAIASSVLPEPLPADTEERMLEFTELAAMSIANAQSHSDLIASRARLVSTVDETRRRIERDLHDGTQQNLVSIGLEIRSIEAAIPPELGQIRQKLSSTAQDVDYALEELQEISRGLHPAILAKGGLEPALVVLARRSPVKVDLSVPAELQLPEPLEVTVYYMVSEALTNVAKHARATSVYVDLTTNEELTCLMIRDDGIGGADTTRGSGLAGLIDRVNALGGRMQITSPPTGGTTLRAEIPRRPPE
ncbi:MAG: sensor histidine kinase [Actinoallomurus sp.]